MRRIIIDTDCGVDDAVALMIALSPQTRSENLEILGITCVAGNVCIDKVVRNVLCCTRAANVTNIPIFRGMDRAIIGPHSSAHIVHGKDGLGDILSKAERDLDLEFDGEHGIVQKRGSYGNSAVNFIIETVMENEANTVDIIAIGPLSNVAMAQKLEPRIGKRLRKLHAMAGSVYGKGNVNPTAEFNVYDDPEAAHICFSEIENVTMVDWDLTLNYLIKPEFWNSESKGKFLEGISEFSVKQTTRLFGNIALPDALAMTAYLEPKCVLSSVKKPIVVELSNGNCRGMTLVNWRDDKKGAKKIEIVTKVDMNLFRQYLKRALAYTKHGSLR